jgi:RNA polymerase sigma-70 factor (ECF subfamily)
MLRRLDGERESRRSNPQLAEKATRRLTLPKSAKSAEKKQRGNKMKDGQVPDAILIERFQRGDNSAMDKLIQRHQARAYQYAFRLTRDRDVAADVVADAFVRVYRAAHTFKGQSAFTTWLYRILTNCFLDMRKKASSRPTVSLEATLQTDDGTLERQFEADARTPHEEAERSERERSIESAVRELPEYQRAMILMFHVEMLSYEEIAESLELPIGTVKSRLNRARLGLRNVLEPERDLFSMELAMSA